MQEAAPRPVGPEIASHPAPRPERIPLPGRFVTLEPLDPERHAAALWAAVKGADQVWDYLFDSPYPDEPTFRADIARKSVSADPMFWAILDNRTGTAVGYASLMRIEPIHRVIEVGSILFTPLLQRTPGATEAMALLATYVFDHLGYRRYEWKCNALNAPSRRAAERLGFTYEGIFRQHMIAKGRNRDTTWFSMLDGEWPAIRAGFEAWLAPENFDDAGRQRRGLAEIRAEGGAATSTASSHQP